MRNLLVCLDGTWNVVDHTTNVWRLYALAAASDSTGNPQIKYYGVGVGSKWYDSLTGGAFGAGVYRNVKEAYNWLCETYEKGDRIHLFGFSRGALTALSLANLIDRCGLIGASSTNTFEDAYRLYRMPGFRRDTEASERFRSRAADYNPSQSSLYFLGLFDTVASLYGKRFTGESIHVISLPQSVRHVYHAIALDENRRSFQSVVFPSAPKEGRLVEKWFSGAHANVGGGYVFDPLSVLPLRWMIESASNVAGLRFRGIPDISVDEVLLARERNSYQEFAFGVPAILSLGLFWKPRSLDRGTGDAEEWIDASAIARFNKFAHYRRTSSALRRFIRSDARLTEGDLNVKAFQPRN